MSMRAGIIHLLGDSFLLLVDRDEDSVPLQLADPMR